MYNYNKKPHNDTNIPSTLWGNQTQILRLTKLYGAKRNGEGMGWDEKFERFVFHIRLI